MRRASLLLAAALLVALPGSAAAATADDLHNQRYCEIIELRGSLPNITANVWNTVTHNDCPEEWWEALDAEQLADELGATGVVLNGPRHWMIDRASAKRGKVREFHGEKMGKVATITIRTAAELVQTPYTDRVINRSNTWEWDKGRTVFELVAPGGDVYVMQAYSQIKDPSLSKKDLPGLGKRLDLPDGWKYRKRKLKRDLVLKFKGAATILQDELQNTYQLAKVARKPGKRVRRAVSLAGTTRTTEFGQGTAEDEGTLDGTPFGKGTLWLFGTFRDGYLDATFRLLFKNGSVIGTANMPFTITGNEIDFNGTAELTGGTGAYRGITGKNLAVHDHNTIDGQNGTIEVEGFAKY